MARLAHAVHTGWHPHIHLPSGRSILLVAAVLAMAVAALWGLAMSVRPLSMPAPAAVPASVVPAHLSSVPAPEAAPPAVDTQPRAMVITIDEPVVITGRIHKRAVPAKE